MTTQAAPPALAHVTDLHVKLGPIMDLGPDRGGRRRVIPIIGGYAKGPRLSGQIVDFGADWQVMGDDGVAEIDTRYMLETPEGALVDIRNPGIRVAEPEVAARLAAGEAVDPSEYYFRCTPRLFCTHPEHAWISRRLFVGVGERRAAEVVMRIFEIG